MMRAPDFWYVDRMGWQATLLLPAAAVYSAFAARRFRRKPDYRSRLPVICIGNPTVGGAGKTPFAILVAQRLTMRGRRPVFLTRGYGAPVKKPILAEAARHTASDVGDEALLLARHAPAVVSPDRVAGALRAERLGDVIIMDDGFQNPALAKDLSILVVDGEIGLGNGMPLPAGPLRLPLGNQLAETQALLAIGSGERGHFVERAAGIFGRPVLHAQFVPDADAAARLSGRSVAAFSGIGRPQKFFALLERLGAKVVYRRTFADHHFFSEEEAASLLDAANEHHAVLATTEKDAARFSARQGAALRRLAQESAVLPVELALDPASSTTLDRLLDNVLA